MAELEQRFHVGDTQAVDFCDCLGKQAEQQRNCQTEDGSKHSAGRLAADAAENDKAHHGDIGAYEEDRQEHGSALHQQRDQDPEQAGQRNEQSQQGFRAGFAAHKYRHHQKQRQYDQNCRLTVIFKDVRNDGPVAVG